MTDEEVTEPEKTPDEMLDEVAKNVAKEPGPTAEQLANHRASLCNTAINEALAQFRCQIVPRLISEPVGNGPVVSKAIVSADYGILPEMG